MAKLYITCAYCGNQKWVDRSADQIAKTTEFCCSKKCWAANQKGKRCGEANNNYGKKWNDEQRKAQAILMGAKLRSDPERFEKFTSTNRGVKFSQERIDKMCANRTPRPKGWFKHSEESKRKVGEASAKKWTPEFKAYMRKIKEELGHYVPLDQLDAWSLYHRQSAFLTKPPKGMCRDHMYSRYNGMANGVFPELLRHPANCEILTINENSQKHTSNSHTLEELFAKIELYDQPWAEQMICLDYIGRYRRGERFSA